MKLELKHLAPYLPYGLKGKFNDDENYEEWNLFGIPDYESVLLEVNNCGHEIHINDFKPILRPLSDLTKEEKLEVGGYIATGQMSNYEGIAEWYLIHRHRDYQVSFENLMKIQMFLFKKHFDVFGLIEKGLAIDINTIK